MSPAVNLTPRASTIRRLRRSRTGSRLFRSAPAVAIDTARRRVATARAARQDPDAFVGTATLLVLLGHVKSGGSLLGALLDAHPDAIVADEADVLRYVSADFDRDQILHLLARGARREAQKGRVTARRLGAYSLAVPGQWQGRVRNPIVIGDSRAGPTTRRAGDDPGLLDRLAETLGHIGVRYVHVVRDPLDPISAMVLRSGRSLDEAISDHREQCDRLALLRSRTDGAQLRTVHYEDLVAEPEAELARLCCYLGLTPDETYLTACAAIMRRDRRPERERVSWSTAGRSDVAATCERFDFLARYRSSTGDDHG